jgi:aspartate aminotransferase
MQAVAAHVLDDPPEVRTRVEASRRLRGRVASAVFDVLIETRLECRAPQAGFYLYPDFGPLRRGLVAHGTSTSRLLAARLLDHHGVAVLPGSAFGDPDTALTVRMATSLLYGTTREQRLAALSAPEPETLPWIADSVTKLRDELRRLGAHEPVR